MVEFRTRSDGVVYPLGGDGDYTSSNSTKDTGSYFARRLSFSKRANVTIDRGGTGYTEVFVRANADCPVCGARVYYYQNSHGSRVFFDELGPPWPKHPCTDNSQIYNHIEFTHNTPQILSGDLCIEPGGVRDDISRGYAKNFNSEYGNPPWWSYLVVETECIDDMLCVVAKRVFSSKNPEIFFAVSKETTLKNDQLIFMSRRQVSYFDEGTFELKSCTILEGGITEP